MLLYRLSSYNSISHDFVTHFDHMPVACTVTALCTVDNTTLYMHNSMCYQEISLIPLAKCTCTVLIAKVCTHKMHIFT